ncbi:uncharacterized protein LOC128989156 [Macrosteles quadrilineatus]|uniref:uncharacterized protein LOC128989156 n=1 Tax=Macrosteles quadrilineatus TaxID=74068 RepID=UPI0023E0D55C|nr:uncharacterized protein LOC128989156 [Macrosteles quadrilineatus]
MDAEKEVPLKFGDFETLEEFISEKEKDDNIQLWIERSRTINGARKKGVKKHINDKLKYYELTYRCIHSGTRKSKSKGIRPNQKTFRQQCPFEMKLRVSENGKTLDVVTYIDQHTHSQDEITFFRLPRQRQLEPSVKKIGNHMLKLKVNKELQTEGEQSPHENSTLKDIHNLNAQNEKEDDDLEDYYVNNSSLRPSPTTLSSSFDQSIVRIKRVLSQQEKFKLVMAKFQQVASLASESSSRVFPQRLKVLEDIVEMWRKQVEVSVRPVESEVDVGEETADDGEDTADVEEETADVGLRQTNDPTEYQILLEHHYFKVTGNDIEAEKILADKQYTTHIDTDTSPDQSIILQNIPIKPPKLKRIGKPKGSDLTVVGLPSKKRRVSSALPFHKKNNS